MNIIDWLITDPFKHDFLLIAIILFGEDEVYAAINMGIVLADDIEIKINIQ